MKKFRIKPRLVFGTPFLYDIQKRTFLIFWTSLHTVDSQEEANSWLSLFEKLNEK